MNKSVLQLRGDFPILKRKVNGKPLVYLDNAATTQKPQQVIDAITKYYSNYNANIHRGIHRLSEEATLAYEAAHATVARFIGATPEEVVFTRNTTESINLIAYAWGEEHVGEGDEVVITILEHHSNFVPWQQLCERKGAKLVIIPIKESGEIELEQARALITEKTKMVAVGQVSNAIGTINPIKEIVDMAHDKGSLCFVDAAQSVPHMPVNVQDIQADFIAFSAHKMLGPMGIGVLYARRKLLEDMRPFLYGGDMILEVHKGRSTWNELPWKFEAGTPNVCGAIAFGEAIKYLEKIGMETIRSHEKGLVDYTLKRMAEDKDITVYGPGDAERMGGVVSFNVNNMHPHDLSTILDDFGIAIRGGHHCAMPLMTVLGVPASSRVSFYIYNTREEVDQLIIALQYAKKVFK